MLDRILLRNYRCFEEAEIAFTPLTVVVGPNASGKTAVLRVCTGFTGGGSDVRNRQHALAARLEWHFRDGSRGVLTHTFEGSSQWLGSPPGGLRGGQYLHLRVDELRSANTVSEARQLSDSGSNLTNLFASLPRKMQAVVAGKLSELVPVLQDVTVRPSQAGAHRLMFEDRWQSGLWYEPSEVSEVSDGTMYVLALLTLQHQLDPIDLVAIEEPEHGLHPFLVGEIVKLMRRLATGELGRPVQVVLATQSAELLEHVDPTEVRFLTRRPEDGAVVVEPAPVGSTEWKHAYEEHQQSLASLWLSGSLGGVPGQ